MLSLCYEKDAITDNNVEAVENLAKQIISQKCTKCKSIQAKTDLLISENSIKDGHTPQPGKIVFNTMRYRKI